LQRVVAHRPDLLLVNVTGSVDAILSGW